MLCRVQEAAPAQSPSHNPECSPSASARNPLITTRPPSATVIARAPRMPMRSLRSGQASIAAIRGANDIRKKTSAGLPDLVDHRQHRDPGQGAEASNLRHRGSCRGAAPPALREQGRTRRAVGHPVKDALVVTAVAIGRQRIGAHAYLACVVVCMRPAASSCGQRCDLRVYCRRSLTDLARSRDSRFAFHTLPLLPRQSAKTPLTGSGPAYGADRLRAYHCGNSGERPRCRAHGNASV
jgi:hypothetical protein